LHGPINYLNNCDSKNRRNSAGETIKIGTIIVKGFKIKKVPEPFPYFTNNTMKNNEL